MTGSQTQGQQQPDEQEPDQVEDVADVDAAGRGETTPELARPAEATEPGSVGGDNGGA